MSEHTKNNRPILNIREWLKGFDIGLRAGRRQGALLGVLATAALVAGGGVTYIGDLGNIRERNTIYREQKARERIILLAEKYNIERLSPESQAAFRRLVSLRPEDTGSAGGTYLDSKQTGLWLQEDIALLNAELVNDGKITDEFDLARELIPGDVQPELAKVGFRFVPVNPVNCDAGETPSYRPFDYSNHLPPEFAVTYTGSNSISTVNIPLGARQTPARLDSYLITTAFSTELSDSQTLLGRYSLSITSRVPDYRIKGCAVLPRGDSWAKRKQVY